MIIFKLDTMNEKQYLKDQQEKIITFARELIKSWDIPEDEILKVYYNIFIGNK